MPLPDIAIGSLLLALISLLTFSLHHNYTKRTNSTELFLELRRGYTEFYRRLHNAFEDLDYKDEINIATSWSSYTNEQQAIAKEYWIQVFNEWFVCNRIANTGGAELWKSFYAPAVASSLRHYVFRRALEESVCELYSFGDNESLFIREIYRICVHEITKNLEISDKEFLKKAPKPITKQQINVISEQDFIGSGGERERQWYRNLANGIEKRMEDKNLTDRISEQSLTYVTFLSVMLNKLTARESFDHYSTPGQAIADAGRKMLLSMTFKQESEQISQEITEILRREYKRIFSIDLEGIEPNNNREMRQRTRALKSIPQKPSWQRIKGSVDLTTAKAWLTCVAAQQAAYEGNYGVGAVIFRNDDFPVAIGANSIFSPRFRSSAHAEMEAMDRLERRVSREQIKEYHLVSSIEPCPMCCCRLITSGLRDLHYLAPDHQGGIVGEFHERMPKTWQQLFINKNYRLLEGGRLSSNSTHDSGQGEALTYSDVAYRIFIRSRAKLDQALD